MEVVKINHDGLLALEQPLIKVPLERLKRSFRSSQKVIEKEISSLVNKLNDICASPEIDQQALKDLAGRLKLLKAKLAELRKEEQESIRITKVRLDYLNSLVKITNVDSDEYVRWSTIRLNTMLVDYLSRHGLNESATKLSKDCMIEDLVDLELFKQAQKIQDSLARHSCTEALQWCNENKSSLKKIKSPLEFNLRLQEYIELVREGKIPTAIQYVRKYLTPWSDLYLKEIQQAMGLLAFNSTTKCNNYRQLYDQKRWNFLINSFQMDNFTLNNLTKQPMLNLTLQAGLTALKTHSCYQSDGKNINCPVCSSESFGKLAPMLPYSHHVNSSLVCRLSGKIMDESNPPLVLPNGYVYSAMALKEMQERDGYIICPRSGATYTLMDTRKAFIS
ncbi:GID complex subunit containing RING finger motif [Boothiomyces sp. JEL0838]|nr:GID complex subunit containing RING finger motif [Boothiomyces sp. JEL0838]